MKKYLGNFGAMWLGFSLSVFAKITFMMWEFYVITIPVLILFIADKKLNKND